MTTHTIQAYSSMHACVCTILICGLIGFMAVIAAAHCLHFQFCSRRLGGIHGEGLRRKLREDQDTHIIYKSDNPESSLGVLVDPMSVELWTLLTYHCCQQAAC